MEPTVILDSHSPHTTPTPNHDLADPHLVAWEIEVVATTTTPATNSPYLEESTITPRSHSPQTAPTHEADNPTPPTNSPYLGDIFRHIPFKLVESRKKTVLVEIGNERFHKKRANKDTVSFRCCRYKGGCPVTLLMDSGMTLVIYLKGEHNHETSATAATMG